MSVKRYRITADVYALDMDDVGWTAAESLIRARLEHLFPLGVVEGYPDIQEIAEDSPFVMTDADAQPRDIERRTL